MIWVLVVIPSMWASCTVAVSCLFVILALMPCSAKTKWTCPAAGRLALMSRASTALWCTFCYPCTCLSCMLERSMRCPWLLPPPHFFSSPVKYASSCLAAQKAMLCVYLLSQAESGELRRRLAEQAAANTHLALQLASISTQLHQSGQSPSRATASVLQPQQPSNSFASMYRMLSPEKPTRPKPFMP